VRSIQLAAVLLSIATLRAQSPASAAPRAANEGSANGAPQSLAAPTPNQDSSPATQRMAAQYQQRLHEMEVSLVKMHALLNDMKTKLSPGTSKGAGAQKDNIELWEMMLGHLDRTLAQARMSALQRGELGGGAASQRRAATMSRRPLAIPSSPATPQNPGVTSPAQPQTGPH